MELTRDFRLNSTPQILIVSCIVLLLLRVILSINEWQHPGERGQAVHWENAETFEIPKGSENTIRLYEFYADWCDPCKRLERDVMTNDEIRNCIQKNFTTLRVTDRQKEDGKNNKFVSELEKKYRIFAFPTIVAVKPDGEPIGLLVGNSSSLAVYRFLSRVQTDASAERTQHAQKLREFLHQSK